MEQKNVKGLVDENATRQDIVRHCEAASRFPHWVFSNLWSGLLRRKKRRLALNGHGSAPALCSACSPRNDGNSGTPQSLISSNHFTHFTHFTHFKKAATQIIRGAAKARSRRTLRAGLADACTAPYRKFGFTLAEVLITLGVIGIVAAMTIPTLISSYQEKVTITKVKKMYATLSNAYALYKVENGDPGFISLDEEGAIQVAEIFKPYLKISKDCGTRGTGCLNGAKFYNNGSLASDETDSGYEQSPEYYIMTLNDGAQLVLRGGGNSHNFEILYDTNFNNNIMRVANDLFAFAGYDDKIIPIGFVDEKYKTCPSDSIGWSCTAWIIKFGNMDYLHCPEILDGETKTSCN